MARQLACLMRTPGKTPKASRTPGKRGRTPSKSARTPSKGARTPSKGARTPSKSARTPNKSALRTPSRPARTPGKASPTPTKARRPDAVAGPDDTAKEALVTPLKVRENDGFSRACETPGKFKTPKGRGQAAVGKENVAPNRKGTPSTEKKRKRASFECPSVGRSGYYTIPSVSELEQAASEELKSVVNFEIGRSDVGYIRFLEPVDLRGVALDKVVRIADSAICLYPSNLFPNGRPEAGAGLNKAALCALYGIFPKRRKGDGTRTQEAFRRKLRSVPNTHFEEYEPETGRWAFRVAAGGWY